MSITITQNQYSRACIVTRNTACARLKNIRPIGSGQPFDYHLAAVLPTTRRKGIPELFSLAEVSDDLFVGEDVLDICRTVKEWLTPDELQRLSECETALSNALAASLRSAELFRYIDILRLKLLLYHGVLRYVMLNDAADLPNWDEFCVPWSIVNASSEELHAEMAA